ncbi:PQQ-binding-like beta-propeller repeat protein [Microbulbifer yueqingensis]|uniref:RHS repeat-associated core domain-containing protein n=1 Tax=Microbulbifer yueqingensis TaxID=658219 RepID=UPI0015870037|nr:PQQ-binding-like beta-propeller repeat protein [Microbulbifer yueqingensis]
MDGRSYGSYQYRVFACNSLECGTPSDPVTVNVQKIPAPKVAWLDPKAGDTLKVGDFVTLRAYAVDEGGRAISLEFFRNSEDYIINRNEKPQVDTSCNNCFYLNWPSVQSETTQLIVRATNSAGKVTKATIPVTVSENSQPEVFFDLDALPQEIVAGQQVTLRAEASDPDGSIDGVNFLVGGTVAGAGAKVGELSGRDIYEYQWTVPSAGTYRVGALVVDNEGAEAETYHDVTFLALAPPEAPEWVKVDGQLAPIPDNTTGYYTVSWKERAGATHGYMLQQLQEGVDTDFQDVPTPHGALSAYLPNQAQGTYRYRVASCNAAGCGEFGTEIRMDVVLSAPRAPKELQVAPDFANYDLTGQYALQWKEVTTYPRPDYYLLEEKAGGLDSTAEWVRVSPGDLSSRVEFEKKSPGSFSYRAKACNAFDCSPAGEIVTLTVQPPTLLEAQPSCDGQCLQLRGSGLDPRSTFTLTDLQTGGQQQLTGESLIWQAPIGEDAATYVRLSLDEAAQAILFDEKKKGLRVSVDNLNGEKAGITAYGDEKIELLSQITSGPAVGADGTIYVGSGQKVFALNPEDGSIVSGWPYTTGDLVKATPTIDSVNGNIYVGSLDDNLYALTQLGLEKWRLETGGDLVSSAVLDDRRIIYQGSMDGVLYAVQAENGAIQWTYPAGAGIAETPVLAGNGTLYFTTVASSEVYALGRGILGPDQLVWESRDKSLLAAQLEELSWQPAESQLPEYQAAARLYRLLLQPPLQLSRDVLTFWTYALVNGASVDEVAGAFLRSDTGKSNFPSTQGNAAFVDALYARAFGSTGHPEFTSGGQTWTRTSLLDALAGSASRAAVAALFAQSMEYTAATNEVTRRSFDYFYTQDYSWAVFSCDEGDEYTRDCDGDSLPDYWEIMFFGDTDSEDAEGDADGDGTSNREAFLAGLDPCANLCRYGVTTTAPDSAPMPTLDPGKLAVAAQVGSLPGNFRVNEAGAATYSIPLSLPAGTAGVVPEVSLNYSSQAGNGLLGHGWSIGGLSAISRCRQTLGQDGQARPITWTAEDRFCLDGQRLLVVSGEYGEPGSRYRTEIDSFAVVTAHGGEPGNPGYFTVERKDGSISYYGQDHQARLDTDSGALAWAISRFEDSAGNPFQFFYSTGAGHRIEEIAYAYTGAGSNPGAKIVFDYEERLDPIEGFSAGEAVVTNERLANIFVQNSVAGSLQQVRKYELEYDDYPADRLSRLARIRQCADNLCQPWTVFDWRLPEPGNFASYAADTVTLSTQEDRVAVGTRPADINGDGRMDLVWLEPDFDPDGDGGSEVDYQWFKYVLAEGDGFGAERNVYREDDDTSRPYEWQMIDYNADGRADLVTYLNDRKHWGVVVAQPDADGNWTLSGSPRYLPELTERRAKFIDINGDGLVDYLTGNEYRLLEPSTAPSSSTYYGFGDSHTANLGIDWKLVEFDGFTRSAFDRVTVTINSATRPADFNGDGIVDPVASLNVTADCPPGEEPGSRGCKYYNGLMVMASSAVGEYGSYAFLGEVDTVESMDINGDGLPDIIYRRGATGYYRLNNGRDFEPEVNLGELPRERQYFDYDSDGNVDLVWHDDKAARLKVRLWRTLEQDFGPAGSFRKTSGDKNAAHLFVDMNGDGVTDYVNIEDDIAELYLARGFRVPVNVVEKVTNGLGAETDISYGSLTNSGHYKRRDVSATTEERCKSAKYSDGLYEPGLGDFAEWCRDYAVADLADYYGYLNDAWEGEDRLGKVSPTLELMGPMYVVTRVDSSAPAAANPAAKSAVSYYYAQAKVQAGGRGMLGFEQLTTVDEQTGVETTTTYRQDFPFQGYPQSTEVRSAQGHLLSESRNTWRLKNAAGNAWQEAWSERAREKGSADLGPLQPWLEKTEETSYELVNNGAEQGSQLKSVMTENEYDTHGNPLSIVVTTSGDGDTFVTATTNEYGPGRSLSLGGGERTLSTFAELGRLTRTEVEHSRTVDGVYDSELRTSEFDYYTSGKWAGLLKEEVIEPDAEDAVLTLTTTYTYDDFGNKAGITRSTAGEESRSSYSFFKGNRGRYLEREENVYGQVAQRVKDRNHLGQPVHVTDMAGVSSFHRYDAFGRKVLDYSETGAHSITLLAAAGSHCPEGTAYQQVTRKAGGGESLTCFDVLARETRTATRGFDGQWVYADTEYDNLGRVTRKSEPYGGSPGAGEFWTVMDYDILGRVIGTDMPGTVSNNGYEGLESGIPHDVHVDYRGYTTVTTNPEGHTKTETRNAQGELVYVRDHLEGTIEYRYDAQGNLRFVTRRAADSGTVPVTEMRYDKLGRKEYMNDPDKGEWHYGYNGFGELEWQIDAKQQVVINRYDRLGRLVSRTDHGSVGEERGEDFVPDSSIAGNIEGDTLWSYNNEAGWDEDVPPGALLGVIDAQSGFARVPSYDRFGRPDSELTSLAEGDDHWTRTTYDEYGRPFQQFDAAGDGSWRSSATESRYNQYGYLSAVVDAENINQAAAENYYTVLEMDERGNVTRSLQGNGVTTVREYDPATGRLERQSASVLGVTQVQDLTYEWDNLGNLEYRHERSGNKDLYEEFDYDGLNRLRSAQVSGRAAQTVKYDGFGNIDYKSDVGHYRYGSGCDRGYGPNAVCETSDGVAYHYDANGNMVSDTSGRSLEYSTFDKPLLIQKGGHTTEFRYGPDRSRYLRIDTDSSGTRTETRYIGNVEKIERSDGFREIKRYLPGGAVVTLATESDGSTQRTSRYLHKDHLGSIDVITDSNGAVVQEMSFDAWGQRRNAQSWEALVKADLTGFDTSLTTRGYTGHEMLDQVGLVHMNGRIYDARLGRFMQADPFVQAASDTQMFNRYSYVRNNPLNATDPSGYFIFTLGAMALIAAADVTAVWAIGLIMGAAGFLDALSQGASFSEALKAGVIQGVSAAAFAGIGQALPGMENVPARMLASGVVGGITSVLQGGKFGHGFVSAGIGAAVGSAKGLKLQSGQGWANLGRAVARVTIAGTVSRATGGKFGNGAAFAAFSVAIEAASTAQISESSAEGEIDFSTEGTESERRERFSKITAGEDNVKFEDKYVGKQRNADGSTTRYETKSAKEFQEWLSTEPVDARRSYINGQRSKFLFFEKITLYRTSVMGFNGRIFLPDGMELSGYFSPLERGYITFGHELAHRNGFEVGNNNVSHVWSNLNGYSRCLSANMCASQGWSF